MLFIDNCIKNLLSLLRFVKVQYLRLFGLIIQREIILIQKMRTFKVMRILSRSCRTYASPFSPCLMMMSSRVDLWLEQFLPMSIRISIETIEKRVNETSKILQKVSDRYPQNILSVTLIECMNFNMYEPNVYKKKVLISTKCIINFSFFHF